jgi:hypothetical protein
LPVLPQRSRKILVLERSRRPNLRELPRPKERKFLGTDPRLALVRESAESGKPIPWVQVHKVPDYVYFNHSVT